MRNRVLTVAEPSQRAAVSAAYALGADGRLVLDGAVALGDAAHNITVAVADGAEHFGALLVALLRAAGVVVADGAVARGACDGSAARTSYAATHSQRSVSTPYSRARWARTTASEASPRTTELETRCRPGA